MQSADLSPKLIDQSAAYYLANTLSKCHTTRATMYSWSLNIGLVIFILAVIGTYIYYCYKTKLTPYEAQQKLMRDQEYVLSKIRYYQAENVNRQVSSLHDLPKMENNIEYLRSF